LRGADGAALNIVHKNKKSKKSPLNFRQSSGWWTFRSRISGTEKPSANSRNRRYSTKYNRRTVHIQIDRKTERKL
jgi:hypothetical protein